MLVTSARGGQVCQDFVQQHFRCPPGIVEFDVDGPLSEHQGYFTFGQGVICFGQCSSDVPATTPVAPLPDAKLDLHPASSAVRLPFDPSQVVENLRRERYHSKSRAGQVAQLVRNGYYLVRPIMPIAVRRHFQKLYLRGWNEIPFPRWPVDCSVDLILKRLLTLSMKARGLNRVPFIWFWPEGSRSCTIMTHDVETAAGVDFCSQLMDLNDSFGIKSSFQVVPEHRYPLSTGFLEAFRKRGFELNVHDLNHDGHLFRTRKEFLERARRINQYARDFKANGFRSAVMYRNQDWYDAFEFSFDMSVPNVAHLDPQRGGCCTVFPYFVGNILELPVTTIQDYSLFNILHSYSINLWKEQIALIQASHGLISVIIHPDYIIADRPRRVYTQLLEHLSALRKQAATWIALPDEVNAWWRLRNAMSLVKHGSEWRIEGEGSERARVAFAVMEGDDLAYEF